MAEGQIPRSVIDFAEQFQAGTRVVLQNTNPPNNISYQNIIDKIMAFDVTDEAFDP